jgi:hypothetical protein
MLSALFFPVEMYGQPVTVIADSTKSASIPIQNLHFGPIFAKKLENKLMQKP